MLNHWTPAVAWAEDFDVRNWNYPTRAAMVSYHHRAREAEVEIGYLLEGKACRDFPKGILFQVQDVSRCSMGQQLAAPDQADDELPEQSLAQVDRKWV